MCAYIGICVNIELNQSGYKIHITIRPYQYIMLSAQNNVKIYDILNINLYTLLDTSKKIGWGTVKVQECFDYVIKHDHTDPSQPEKQIKTFET